MVATSKLRKSDLTILGFNSGTVRENKMKLKQKLRDYGIDSRKHDVHGLRRAISKEFHQRKRESIKQSKKKYEQLREKSRTDQINKNNFMVLVTVKYLISPKKDENGNTIYRAEHKTVYKWFPCNGNRNNEESIKNQIANQFEDRRLASSGDFGNETSIVSIKIHQIADIREHVWSNVLMRDSDSEICVLECILQRMKDVEGYKRYTMDDLKREF